MSSKMFSYHQPLTLGTPLSPHFQQTSLHTSKENTTIHFHEKIEKNYFFQSYAVATHYYYSFFLQLVMIYKIIIPLIMEGMFSFLFHTSFSLLGEESKKPKGCRSKVSGEYLNFSSCPAFQASTSTSTTTTSLVPNSQPRDTTHTRDY